MTENRRLQEVPMRPASYLVPFAFLLAAAGPALPAEPVKAPERLESWLPDDVIGYVKGADLGNHLDAFLASDARRDLEAMPLVQHALSQHPWQEFMAGLEEFKKATGKDAVQLFRAVLGKDALLGVRFNLAGPEVILLSRAAEKDVEETLTALRELGARHLGRPVASEKTKHLDHSLEVFEEGKLCVANLGGVVAVANSRAGVETVIGLAAGKATNSAAASEIYRKAADLTSRDTVLSVAARPRFIPHYNVPEKSKDAGASLLGGGIEAALQASELLVGGLTVAKGKASLELASLLGEKARSEKIAEKLKIFFPEITADPLIARLRENGALATFSLARDLASWWEKREDLMAPGAAGGLIEFAQVMSAVFGGRNFQDEVLPEFGPNITVVAHNQKYADLKERPKPSVPGFALLFELKNASEFGNNMAVAFQTLIAFINADRAQKKNAGVGMMLKTESVGGVDFHTVALTAMTKEKPGMAHNFTPSLAVVGSRVILSSSAELAKTIIAEMKRDPQPEAGKTAVRQPGQDLLFVEASQARSILAENLDFLVADNMMKKGQTKEQAEAEFKVVLAALERLRDLRVETRREGDTIRLKADLRTTWGGEAKAAKEEPASGTKKRGVKL
jgi:hypothetical protein